MHSLVIVGRNRFVRTRVFRIDGILLKTILFCVVVDVYYMRRRRTIHYNSFAGPPQSALRKCAKVFSGNGLE